MPLHFPMCHPKSKGFIALISVLIVSTILFASVIAVSESDLTHRFQLLELERKMKSEKLAESCVHLGKAFIYNDPLVTKASLPYGGIFQIGDETCSVTSITPSALHSEIVTHGKSSGAVTSFRAIIQPETGNIISWKEIP